VECVIKRAAAVPAYLPDRIAENPNKLDSVNMAPTLLSRGGMNETAIRPPTYEDGQDLRERALAFACRVVRFCQRLYETAGVGRMMVPQLVNCSTSTASMLEEAKAAESDRDFISKCCIS
jgi:hypothetical protein